MITPRNTDSRMFCDDSEWQLGHDLFFITLVLNIVIINL